MSILVSGSIAYDQIMRFNGKFKDHILPDKIHIINLSFLVDELNKNLGGTGGNIAYNLALLGEHPYLFGTVGKDFDIYAEHCQKVGIDIRFVQTHADLFTANFFVTTDLDHNQIAAFYPGAMARSAQNSIHQAHAENPMDLAIISPDDPQAMILHCEQCREAGIPFIFDIGQQVIALDGEQLLACVKGARALICNDYEIEVFLSKAEKKVDDLLELTDAVVITEGAKGSEIVTKGTTFDIRPGIARTLVDPTGAGDAYRAGFLFGMAHACDWHICGQIASIAAVYAVEQAGTQMHRYTLEEFCTRYQETFGEACPVHA
ncbi:MAG TPA: carbohydrate kinase family protein [bacterium]|nr:carbohydrate kinase family protein [bacterium]